MKNNLLFVLCVMTILVSGCAQKPSDITENKDTQMEILKETIKMQEAMLDDAEEKTTSKEEAKTEDKKEEANTEDKKEEANTEDKKEDTSNKDEKTDKKEESKTEDKL